MCDENNIEEIAKELTLLLLYLNRFTTENRHNSNSDFYSWKGYNFDTLNSLDQEGLISQGNHRSKSVYLTEEGIKEAIKLLDKYSKLFTNR